MILQGCGWIVFLQNILNRYAQHVWVGHNRLNLFLQGDVEKEQGLPVGPVMDRDTVRKGSSQTGFISVFMLPMFKLLTKVSH